MPSNKRKIQFLLDDEYYEKFKFVMKKEKRKSESSMSQYIVEKYIDNYESNNGKIIKIEKSNDFEINM